MTTVLFDTLALARKLEQAGFPAQQAQATSAALAEASGEQVATTRDLADLERHLLDRIEALRHELLAEIESVRRDLAAGIEALRRNVAADTEAVRRDLAAEIEAVRREVEALRGEMIRRARELEQRLTIKLGAMMAAAIGIVAVLVRLF